MTWDKGHDEILRLLDADPPELERVEPNQEHAGRLLAEAETHLTSCDAIVETDYAGAAQLAYDAARKACAALLAVQGLRATRRGGHIAVADAVREQFNGSNGNPVFKSMNRLRRERAETQYPRAGTPTVTLEDATEILGTARELVGAARLLLDAGVITPFG